jgi:hypothetical protein
MNTGVIVVCEQYRTPDGHTRRTLDQPLSDWLAEYLSRRSEPALQVPHLGRPHLGQLRCGVLLSTVRSSQPEQLMLRMLYAARFLRFLLGHIQRNRVDTRRSCHAHRSNRQLIVRNNHQSGLSLSHAHVPAGTEGFPVRSGR